MSFHAKFFNELTTTELYEIVRARTEIFLMERRIICRDFDGVDYDCLHCFTKDGNTVTSYLRAFQKEEGIVKVGRVLTLQHGQGHGASLMKQSIKVIKEQMNAKTIILNAQKHAQGFYEKLGFLTVSDDFLEEGIPHVAMRLDLD